MRYSVIITEDGDTFHDTVEADNQEQAETAARDIIANAWNREDTLIEARAEGDETAFDAHFDSFAVDPVMAAPEVQELLDASRALLDEFGGNTPDYLRAAAGRLESAITLVQGSLA